MKEIEEIIKQIEEKYTGNEILDILDNEILNWDYGYTVEEIQDGWDSHWDFYSDFNNGEAESAVMDEILFSIGLSCNKLFEVSETAYYEFVEWLTEYTGYNFNI